LTSTSKLGEKTRNLGEEKLAHGGLIGSTNNQWGTWVSLYFAGNNRKKPNNI